jgi:hypothetical protein
MRHAFAVDEPTGERWNVALEVIARGESAVAIGDLNVLRDVGAPTADGRLCVEIRATTDAQNLTRARAEADVASGLVQLNELLAKEAFAALAAEHGLSIEYVDDYDTSRTSLARIAADRSITRQGDFEPRT